MMWCLCMCVCIYMSVNRPRMHVCLTHTRTHSLTHKHVYRLANSAGMRHGTPDNRARTHTQTHTHTHTHTRSCAGRQTAQESGMGRQTTSHCSNNLQLRRSVCTFHRNKAQTPSKNNTCQDLSLTPPPTKKTVNILRKRTFHS